ncbi:hypothetical protein N7491_007242 [Penicillium cf. griseofulvum]|uniref:Mucin-7 n=1 Tax=Penicillium cf. griseofulvum TaxID=2972120 RepID=A0A9W9ITP8_9EURO|nr:hypothetical protein N7472_009729 [Penicillium cf. griseofulvum]KAJ5430226.1 hypothetical protein N7491_007242 [Penicillium cf. griseofulvum]KAJ5436004.1 hypothetical protein N7445_006889 [Penicillium cf. griseofulvum]
MSDNNPHHPGVRSLLAKFEGQSPIASPPPRGRSPAASDSSGTVRQLSKVRASFITVDGVVQSNPASPLRKTSGRGDSPGMFGPKINSGDAESGRQTMISPTPLSRLDHTQNATMGQIMAEGRPEKAIETKSGRNQTAKEEPAAHTETEFQLRNIPPKQTEEPISTDSKSTSSDTSQKSNSSGPIKKKPSSVGSARSAASKSVSTNAASTGAKPAAHKPSSKPTAREVAKERVSSLAHKPSRVSLNPKTTVRPARGLAPTQDTSKPPSAGVSSKPGMKSPPKPARVPGSTHASAAKPGSTGAPSTRTTTSASTLTRKPSSLKSATGGQSHAATPSTSVRRQASRPSLPAQAAHDTTTKPVNEGFLARMMRPTASSANKSHPQEKTDAKPVTKTTSVPKAPRPSIGRLPDRSVPHVKPKSTALRPQSQKSQALNKEPAPKKDGHKPPQKKQESEKENIVEPITASPKEPAAVDPAPVAAIEQPEAASKPVEETASPAQVEEVTPEVAIASAEPIEKSIEVPEPIVEETVAESSSDHIPIEDATEVQAEPIDSNETKTSSEAEVNAPVEALIEPITEDVEEEQAAETPTPTEETATEPMAIPTSGDEVEVGEKQETSIPEPELLETPESAAVQVEAEKEDDVPVKGPIVTETLAGATEENPTEAKSTEPAPDAQPATEIESNNVAIDIATLSLH